MNYKTVIFDFDSTLVTIEGIDQLALYKGIYPQVSELTKKAMEGSLSFEQVFAKRLDLIKPDANDLNKLSQDYANNLSPYATQVIKQLQDMGLTVLVVSGGYEQAILPVTTKLGIPPKNVYSIRLGANGIRSLTKPMTNTILIDQLGKRNLIKSLDLNPGVIFVGDGSTDLAARDVVDLFVGFGGVVNRPSVASKAGAYIDDLSSIFTLIDTPMHIKNIN